jgi:hypothetical protein
VSYIGKQPDVVAVPGNSSITNPQVAGNAAIEATKLSFTQSGTGAVARTVEGKLREVVSVKDFGAVGDGVTDDTAAIQAAAVAASQSGRYVYAPSGIYILSDTIIFAPTDPTLVCDVGVIGDGAASTVFRQTNRNKDTFYVSHSSTSLLYRVKPRFQNFCIEYRGTLNTDTGAAIRHRQCNAGVFENITISSAPFGIRSQRSVQSFYSKIYHNTNYVASGHYTQAFLVFETDYILNAGTSFGNYVSNCESQSGPGCKNALLLRGVDGLYVNNCHFDYAETTILIEPNNIGGNNTVRQLLVSNCYFDSNSSTTLQHKRAVFIDATGTGSATIFGLKFSNCTFRGDGLIQDRNAGGVRITGTDRTSSLAYVSNISFTGCEFLEYKGEAINFSINSAMSANAYLRGIAITGCHFIAPSSTPGLYPSTLHAIILQGSGCTVTGNIFDGPYTSNQSVLIVAGFTRQCTISSNSFTAAVVSTNPILINPSAIDVKSFGNIAVGQGVSVSQIEEEGTNANGYYVKYVDGRMHCAKSLTLTSQDINTPAGNVFISSNVITGSQAFPQSFISVPRAYAQASVSDAFAWSGVAGVPTTVNWFPTLHVFYYSPITNRTITAWLFADGRWK